MLWLWCRLVATAPSGPLAWEPPYATGVALKKKKKTLKISRRIKDLNSIKLDTIKPLEENSGRTLFDVNHSNILLDLPPQIMTIKTQINQWDLIKIKSFCTAKETIKNNEKTTHRIGENLCK